MSNGTISTFFSKNQKRLRIFFGLGATNFWQGPRNCIHLSIRIVWEEKVSKKHQLIIFIEFQDFNRIIFGNGCQTALYVSRETFQDIYFSKKKQFSTIFFAIWAKSNFWQKIFSRVVQNGFFVSRGTFWGIFLRKIIILKIFWTLSENFSDFRQKNSAGFSKLHFTCAEKHFEVIFLIQNK